MQGVAGMEATGDQGRQAYAMRRFPQAPHSDRLRQGRPALRHVDHRRRSADRIRRTAVFGIQG